MSLNVVITGANRGIGLSFCKYYHNRNFNVFGVCRQSSSELDESATKVIENIDIASSEACKNLFNQLSEIKIDILINNQKIDALSMIVHKSFSTQKAREIAANLQKLIPRQMFDVPIQVALGSKIISRETVKALRKNVTAKCYGGDITRKKKLLEKQKDGKKKMKQFGKVSIPQDAFLNYFKSGE
jgi:translation elongation factor EF-4